MASRLYGWSPELFRHCEPPYVVNSHLTEWLCCNTTVTDDTVTVWKLLERFVHMFWSTGVKAVNIRCLLLVSWSSSVTISELFLFQSVQCRCCLGRCSTSSRHYDRVPACYELISWYYGAPNCPPVTVCCASWSTLAIELRYAIPTHLCSVLKRDQTSERSDPSYLIVFFYVWLLQFLSAAL